MRGGGRGHGKLGFEEGGSLGLSLIQLDLGFSVHVGRRIGPAHLPAHMLL